MRLCCRYVPGSGVGSIPQSSHFPQTTSLLFEACNKQGITAKFVENNQLVDAKVALSAEELEELLSGIFVSDDASNIRAR